MKRIIILGSTGSIGKNALEVVKAREEDFEVVGLSGNQNVLLLREQILQFRPKYVAVGNREAYQTWKQEFPNITFFYGNKGLEELASVPEYDILLTAISGSVGIQATVQGIVQGKRIALANKETLVSAGPYINSLLRQYPQAEIIPVDSEHSAIFQCLQGNQRVEVKKLILTASGGPFRGKKRSDLERIRVQEALKHPNWSMGKKISIDSASLVNKGLEMIEAHELFGLEYSKIDAILHPQSIVHSMVEYRDSSVIAQMGVPDMKLPIQYALTYPNRLESPVLESLDFFRYPSLTFERIDEEVFQGISLARKAGEIGGVMPAIFNATNEIAVELFLEEKISFLEIYAMLAEAISFFPTEKIESLEHILEVDKQTREWARRWGK